MAIAKLILDYVQTLIWPALLVGALVRFGPQIGAVFRRVSTGGQLQVGAAGFNVLLDFRNTLAELADKAETLDAPALRESLKQAERKLDRELRALTSGFYKAPIDERRRIATELAQAAATMHLDELLELAHSDDPGERVGAAIGLRDRMHDSEPTREDPRVLSALRSLLGDTKHSRVRYRAAEALRESPELVPTFRDEMTRLAESDSNAYVCRMARHALDRTSG
jgi:hypothetical protein